MRFGLIVKRWYAEAAVMTTCLVIQSLSLLDMPLLDLEKIRITSISYIIMSEEDVDLNAIVKGIEAHEVKLKVVSEKKKSADYKKTMIEYRFLVEYKEGNSF
ncbi:hypothetical protein MM221_09305 [Salipaludibacillus sp. LMS25]|jgi:hypothetical protein|uniref:hypothetical protein n=1 Tax=Salipaludibacillus sp. LMS25 TaxID=2924031 RepID=UPI0020D056E0|nr:hypothetical protein [Salipaludibacillus sp. LMS25]UTR16684.1 hypothetical protein MM221_09305 [Salipaludibacillus sp. LMS25]